jgi:hypothetical protein
MTKWQTKFRRRDVNGGSARCAELAPPQGIPVYYCQQLSWRSFAVGKNFSYRRCKVINTRARHYDAVTAAMSFLRDAQEFSAVVLPELDVEMLALNLQFFRLDDVIHFALRTPSLGSQTLKWKKNRDGKENSCSLVSSLGEAGQLTIRAVLALSTQGCPAAGSI